MRNVVATFLVTLKQIGLKWIGVILLASILLSSFLVIKEQKDINLYQDSKILFSNKEELYEKKKFLEEYKGNDEKEELEALKKEVEKELLEIDMAEKYGIISSDDPRYYYLNQWGNLKRDLEGKSEAEQNEIKVQLDELEYQFSLTYQDTALRKIEQLKSDLEDANTLPEGKEKEKKLTRLTEEIELTGYEAIPEIHFNHPIVGMVKRAYFHLTDMLEDPVKEDVFYQNQSLLEKYSTYEEYKVSFQKSVEYAKDQYECIKEELRLGIQESYYDNLNIQTFGMKDGLFTMFSYTTIATILFLVITIHVFHNDYDNHMMIQYKVHMPMKHYLFGKYLALVCLLFISFLLGLIANMFVSYLLSPGYIPTLLLVPMNPGFIVISFPLWYLLQILVLFLLAVLLIICIGTLSTTNIPRSIIYFILILLIGICFYQTMSYTDKQIDFLKYFPFTYLRYGEICKNHLLPDGFSMIYQMLGIITFSIIAAFQGHKRTAS